MLLPSPVTTSHFGRPQVQNRCYNTHPQASAQAPHASLIISSPLLQCPHQYMAAVSCLKLLREYLGAVRNNHFNRVISSEYVNKTKEWSQ